ncbi:MAG: aminotransferase class IV [Anaerolineae bacterium]|nr:aminotransferase class IV [Anaerolineae bacterium]
MSPAFIQELTPQGLHAVPYRADSLADAAQYEPDGIYTVTNTYHTFQTLKLDAHLDRMEDSAAREGIPLKLDRRRLREALRQMISKAQFGDVRFRITVPREVPNHAILTLEPYVPPSPALINGGVRCVTVPGLLRRNPAAKTNDWVADRSAVTLPEGIYQGLLVNDQEQILEGFSSNFYAILNGELRTAGEEVLAGIAQQIIFAVAPGILILRRDAIRMSDLPDLNEAFLTSSSRGVIPIIEIDEQSIGDGAPGPRTMAIRRAYNKWVEAHLEDL